MPHTEDRAGQCCQWIGRKVGGCQRHSKSAVLHADFDGDCGGAGILYFQQLGGKKTDPHTEEVVEHNDTQYENPTAYNLFCVVCYDTRDDHYNGYD